jgi:2,5-diketo-D-gluconate reductase B
MELPFSPPIGLGTAAFEADESTIVDAVVSALEAGYRHVDTAQVYGTEAQVGEAIARADVPREEVFVATKTAHIDNIEPGREPLRESVLESRERLGVETIDCCYVHWPMGVYDPAVTLPALDELRDEGVVDHVAVSNFTVDLLEEARDHLDAPLFANQVETHPLLQQDELVAYAREHDLVHVAYSPLMAGRFADVPELATVAEKHDVTPAQVCVAWLADREPVVPIPKSLDPAHQRANLEALDVPLDDEDRECIAAIDREERIVDNEDAPWNAGDRA